MRAQAVSEFPVGWIEEVLADVAQKMEMTDNIRYSGENLGHRLTDAGPHIMDAGGRVTIVLPQFL